MGRLDKWYARLPVWAQHGVVSGYGLYWRWYRFGPGAGRFLQEYLDRESWSADQWRAWQEQQLRELLGMAAQHVPFYRARWSESEAAAARVGRLSELPLLEKDDLRAAPQDFVRQDQLTRSTKVWHTSGSTGTPVRSIWTTPEMRRSRAVREARSARWAGVSFRLPRATFSGRLVEPRPHSRGPFHRFNLAERQVYFSAYHLRSDTAAQYVKALREHRIVWMTGYAVSYYLLAQFILEQGLTAPGTLRAVVTTSEKLTPKMRQVMQQAYGCRVFEEYSTVENALFASECEQGRLHVSPDVGVVEILRPDGSACAPGEVGEVVATCLLRTYQPLIRYRLGDCACWDDRPCPCGRAMPVIKEVVGRIEDVVIGPDGRRLVRFHGLFTDQPHVREAQVVQETLDRLRILVVPLEGFGAADIHDLTHRARQRLGDAVRIEIETVEHIPRTSAGKFQAVVSRLREQGVAEAERTGGALG